MTLIPCTADCVYQKDGCCNLERAAPRGAPEPSGESCVHYVRRRKGPSAPQG